MSDVKQVYGAKRFRIKESQAILSVDRRDEETRR